MYGSLLLFFAVTRTLFQYFTPRIKIISNSAYNRRGVVNGAVELGVSSQVFVVVDGIDTSMTYCIVFTVVGILIETTQLLYL